LIPVADLFIAHILYNHILSARLTLRPRFILQDISLTLHR